MSCQFQWSFSHQLHSVEHLCFVRLEAHLLKLENRSRNRLAYEVQMCWKCQIMSPLGWCLSLFWSAAKTSLFPQAGAPRAQAREPFEIQTFLWSSNVLEMSNYVSPGLKSRIISISGEDVSVSSGWRPTYSSSRTVQDTDLCIVLFWSISTRSKWDVWTVE